MRLEKDIRSQSVLFAVSALSIEHGYPPSLEELANAIGLKPTRTLYYVDQLCLEGKLRRTKGVARSIVVIK